jgi:dihydropteroate synthase
MIYFPSNIQENLRSRFEIELPACGQTLDTKNYVFVMGILNMSPDSFYFGYENEKEAILSAEKMIEDGVDIIDIGGQSTRPGADEIPEEEEIRRIKNVIYEIRKNFPRIPISVDTYRSSVAEIALDLGADIVNDISGFRFDEKIPYICQKYKAPAIVMHITAKPKIMQSKLLEDTELIEKIKLYLSSSANIAENLGIKVILDPGIGFGKKPHQNLIIINRLDEIVSELNYPLLLGVSRKSFIGFCISQENPPPPSERLEGTISAISIALQKGARIFRVHDVLPSRKALKTAISILSERFAEEKFFS